MTDLIWLTRYPEPAFTMTQSSSYDRASKPGGDMFANGDYGQFIREETNGGRKEFVMADLTGPGAVVRIWSANPSGTIRFYFDGSTTALIEEKMLALLTGKIGRWGDWFSYNAAHGCNLYFPFPYAKSLKVTVEDTDGADKHRGLYYHVNTRTYAPETEVATYSPADTWDAPKPPVLPPPSVHKEARLNPQGAPAEVSIERSGGCIRQFSIILAPPIGDKRAVAAEIYRQILVTASFDGEHSIEMPLGDLFGTAPGLNAQDTIPITIAGKELVMRWPMPFAKSAKFSFRNVGRVPVGIACQFAVEPYSWDSRSMHFHAQWTVYHGRSRPFRDMHLLDVRGKGMYVGTFLHVANPTAAWWGEGDEKVYVDGESFPSTFGTGTEDYFGYAWSANEPFNRPFHAQTHVEKPGNFGHSAVERWHIFDPFPFQTGLKFDLELWHWQDVETTFARGAYWYAIPGGTEPIAVNEELLIPPVLEPAKPVPGAIEGETMKVLKRTSGNLEVQSDFWEPSSGKQLWWTEPAVGGLLELAVPVPSDGTYEVSGNFCHAADYGSHRLSLAGHPLKDLDFYGTGVVWKKYALGTVVLKKGISTLKVECLGHNVKAEPKNMFGLDYIMLTRRP